MASYYVDFDAGSDSNSGTSTGSPFKRCPGDPSATGTAASASLAAGDSVFFRAGVVYVGRVILGASGSSGSPITFDGRTWAGSGARAILTSNHANTQARFDDNGTARSWLVFVGLLIREVGGYSSDDAIWGTTDPVTAPPNGAGINLGAGGTDITIDDCRFEEIGQWENRAPMSGTTSVTGTAIILENNARVLVEDCDFTKMKTGVSIKATTTITDITVRGCEFHHYMNWLIDIAPRAVNATLSNIDIDRCTFRDYNQFNTPNWLGYGEKPHQDGIFIRGGSVTGITWTNVVVRNCVWSGDDSSAGGTASIYLSQGASADIYNCVFYKDKQSRSVFVSYPPPSGVSAQNVSVRNCTFYGSSRCLEMTPTGSARVVMNNVDVRNNVFYRTLPYNTVTIDTDDTAGTFVMDYNVFYNTNSAQTLYTGSFRTFANWQSYSSQDANSVYADPVFDGETYRLSAGSPAIGAGENLSAYFSTDADGNTRPASGAWDIGAFQYGEAPPPTPPAARGRKRRGAKLFSFFR